MNLHFKATLCNNVSICEVCFYQATSFGMVFKINFEVICSCEGQIITSFPRATLCENKWNIFTAHCQFSRQNTCWWRASSVPTGLLVMLARLLAGFRPELTTVALTHYVIVQECHYDQGYFPVLLNWGQNSFSFLAHQWLCQTCLSFSAAFIWCTYGDKGSFRTGQTSPFHTFITTG